MTKSPSTHSQIRSAGPAMYSITNIYLHGGESGIKRVEAPSHSRCVHYSQPPEVRPELPATRGASITAHTEPASMFNFYPIHIIALCDIVVDVLSTSSVSVGQSPKKCFKI